MNILKYSLLWGVLICTMAARGQKIEILHEGEEPVWLSELHQFVWDKVIPLHFKAGKAVYEVHHAPKVFRLATELGYSSWFFVGDKDHVTVTVLNTDPLNIKVEGDIAGTYFYELENVSREYTRGKLEMTSDYMKAWLDKDATLMREVNQQLERLKMNRDSAYMDGVANKAANKQARHCRRHEIRQHAHGFGQPNLHQPAAKRYYKCKGGVQRRDQRAAHHPRGFGNHGVFLPRAFLF